MAYTNKPGGYSNCIKVASYTEPSAAAAPPCACRGRRAGAVELSVRAEGGVGAGPGGRRQFGRRTGAGAQPPATVKAAQAGAQWRRVQGDQGQWRGGVHQHPARRPPPGAVHLHRHLLRLRRAPAREFRFGGPESRAYRDEIAQAARDNGLDEACCAP